MKNATMNKEVIRQEMLKAQRELNNLLSYVRYGETLSGSHVEDWKKISELRKKSQDLLSILKNRK